VTGKPRQVSRTFTGSERAAAKALTVLVAEVGAGKFKRTTATVGQLLDKWLEFASQPAAPATVYENRSKIKQPNSTGARRLRLDKLEPDTLDGAYRMWLEQGLSPSTVHQYHAILSAACRQAVKWGWIDRAPTDRSTPPQPVRKEMLVPTSKQLSDMVKTADDEDPVLGTAVALAADRGPKG